jgi:hypothetical protein
MRRRKLSAGPRSAGLSTVCTAAERTVLVVVALCGRFTIAPPRIAIRRASFASASGT